MVNSLTKELIKLSTKLNPISVGTKFFQQILLKQSMLSYLIILKLFFLNLKKPKLHLKVF